MLKQLYDWLNKRNKIRVKCELCETYFYTEPEPDIDPNTGNYCSFQCCQNKIVEYTKSKSNSN